VVPLKVPEDNLGIPLDIERQIEDLPGLLVQFILANGPQGPWPPRTHVVWVAKGSPPATR
jgi:hypothetical protein